MARENILTTTVSERHQDVIFTWYMLLWYDKLFQQSTFFEHPYDINTWMSSMLRKLYYNINNKYLNNVMLWVKIKLVDCCKKHVSNLYIMF